MKRRYRVLIVFVAVALALTAIVAAFYKIENWRGARAWAQAQRRLAAQGESLDAADFIPPPVPDAQNLAMIPLFARALDYRVDLETKLLTFGPKLPDDTPFRDMPYGRKGRKPKGAAPGGWEAGQRLALETIQRFYAKQDDFPHPAQPRTPSEDTLLALTKLAPAVEEIEEAIPIRPLSRFPVNWLHWPPTTIVLPHYNLIQKITGVLRLRALAHLEAGRHAEAAHELATAFRLRAAIEPEPMMIGHLVIITCDGLLLQPIWEGLAARRWTADELREIQRELRADDLLADYVRAIRGERAIFVCAWLNGLRKAGSTREIGPMLDDDPEQRAWIKMYRQMADLYPRGWIDQNEATVCLAYQEMITGDLDLKARRVYAGRVKARQQRNANERKNFDPTRILLKMVTPVFESILSRAAQTQTACEQAEVACALERYFLNRHSYPQNLETLVPEFLDRVPTDLIDGAPLRYRLTDDGRYLLYGMGWNERDDSGIVGWSRSAPTPDSIKTDRNKGDWVWQYQPVSPPNL